MSGRALALVVRLLPGHRRDWGEAMQAEYAAIEGGAARRRHALGCARTVLLDRGALRTLVLYAVALGFGVAVLALTPGQRSIGVRVETIVLVGVLGLLVWSGRRSGVADEPAAGRLRSGGYAVLAGCLLLLLTGPGGGGGDPEGWWIAGVAIALSLAAVLVVTGRGTHTGALRIVAAVSVSGALAWWIPLVLLAGVRAHPQWSFAVIAACAVLAARLAAPSGRADIAAPATAFATCLLIFVAALATYAIAPGLAPDIATAQAIDPRLENQIESTDPYIATLLAGALLGALLIAAVRARPRPVARLLAESAAKED
jgi:hypothetical protein